jgi:hypothetical protein
VQHECWTPTVFHCASFLREHKTVFRYFAGRKSLRLPIKRERTKKGSNQFNHRSKPFEPSVFSTLSTSRSNPRKRLKTMHVHIHESRERYLLSDAFIQSRQKYEHLNRYARRFAIFLRFVTIKQIKNKHLFDRLARCRIHFFAKPKQISPMRLICCKE